MLNTLNKKNPAETIKIISDKARTIFFANPVNLLEEYPLFPAPVTVSVSVTSELPTMPVSYDIPKYSNPFTATPFLFRTS